MSKKSHYILNIKNMGLISLILIGIILYLPMMPQTVQMFDTGELVTNSYLLRVIHPPGYPVYTWLYYLFTHVTPGENIFWLASLLTVILSLTVLSIIYKTAKNSLLGFSISLLLMSSALYWRYSLLPDVFMLHALFTSFILYLYLQENEKWGRLILVWCISTAHHHTTIFLLPILIHVFINKKRFVVKSFIYGLCVSLFFYLSLLVLDTTAIESWGNLTDLSSLLKHILRTDYGTFKLTTSTGDFSLFENLVGKLIFYFNHSLSLILPIGGVLIWGGLKTPKEVLNDKRLRALIISFFFYIFVFFSLSNIELSPAGKEVFSRFMLMANIIWVFLGLRVVQIMSLDRKIEYALSILILCFVGVNLYSHRLENDFSKNTVMSDWAKNKLEMAKENDIILEKNDSEVFSLYYVQNILNIKSEVPVVSTRLLFYEWYFDKVINTFPNLNLDRNKFLNLKNYDIYQDFLLPNLAQHSFFTSEYNVMRHPKIGLEYTVMGTRLHETNNVMPKFNDMKLSRNQANYIISEDGFTLEKKILSRPCIFYLINVFANPNGKTPNKELEKALSIVPICYQAANELCRREYKKQKYCALAKKNKIYESFFIEESFY